MDLLDKIDDNQLIELMKKSKNRVYLSLPSLYLPMTKRIIDEVNASDIGIIVDFSEEKIRDGFGDIDSIMMLKKSRIKLRSLSNNMVSFIICDDMGYFLFPKSKYSHETEENINAVIMNEETVSAVIDYFFKTEPEIKNDINTETEIDKSKDITPKFQAKEISETIFNQVKDNIVNNPPLDPDFKKILNVYRTKLEFVEFQFDGANIASQKVNIPSRLLPFKDEAIIRRLETKFVLFKNIENREEFKKFAAIKETVKKLRNTYLLPFSARKKSFIDKTRKKDFLSQVEKCRKDLLDTKQSLSKALNDEMIKSKEQFVKELQDFFNMYPDNQQQDIINDRDSINLVNKNKATEIVYRINYPNIDKLLKDIDMKCYFYDITYNELKDDNFLESLVNHNIISEEEKSSLTEECKAIEAKNKNQAELIN
jgi:hypothetical protein